MSEKLSKFIRENKGVLGVYGGIFFHALFGGLWTASLPYIIKRLGGSDTSVGLCVGIHFVAYIISLTLSFIYSKKIAKINLKHLAMIGTGLVTFTVIGTYLVLLDSSMPQKLAMMLVIFFGALQGIGICCIWPRIPLWLSIGHSGKALNHRLGLFNFSWSFASITGPAIGGYLIEAGSQVTLAVASLLSAMSFVMICFAHKPQNTNVQSHEVELSDSEDILFRVKYKWALRIIMFSMMVCMGLMRSQVALFFKFTKGFTESDFGMGLTLMSLAAFIIFTITGRTHKWHYKKILVLITQFALICGLLLLTFGNSLYLAWVGMIFIGGCRTFIYNSHQFYSLNDSKDRSNVMVIHEFVICMGIITGSFMGGFLSDHINRYAPYYFAIAVIIICLTIAGFIWTKKPPKTNICPH